MRGRIKIQGLKAFGFHGVQESEKQKGQDFLIDIEFSRDVSLAIASDELADTVDYALVSQKVKHLVETENFNLLETLANKIAASVLENETVSAVRISVTKPSPPMEAEVAGVSVTLRVKR